MFIKRKKDLGTIELSFIMVLALMFMIVIGALTYYRAANYTYNKLPFDRLGFIYHLTLSKKSDIDHLISNNVLTKDISNNNTVLLNTKGIALLQDYIISTLKCENNYCRKSNYEPALNSFMLLTYDETNTLNDLKFYFNIPQKQIFTGKQGSIISINEKFMHDTDRVVYSIKEDPDFKYVVDIYKHLTYEYYLDSNFVEPVSKELCLSDANKSRCLYMLHYNKEKTFEHLNNNLR